MNEIWKDVVGYEGLYQVSNLGNVKSLERIILCGNNNYKRKRLCKERVLKPSISSGYLYVILSNKKRNGYHIHKLVAIAFLNHIPCGHNLVVNHIDFNKLNNNLSNLEIITNRQNSRLENIKGTSNEVGVHWDKHTNKWRSCIIVNSKSIHLGLFNDEKEASLYYKNALESINNNTVINIKKAKYSSKFKGVSWSKPAKKWYSRIQIDKKIIYLGLFDDEELAHEAYQSKLNEINHGNHN